MMFFHRKALGWHLTTRTTKQIAAFLASLKREDTNVKPTEQQVMNKYRFRCWLQEELLRRPQVTEYQPALASHTQLTNRTDHPHSDHNDEPQSPM